MDNYHQGAQKFIKSSKKLGLNVAAEGSEIIASPKNSAADKAFHAAAGTHSIISNIKNDAVNVVKKAGKVATKVATKLTGPIVRNIKASDATGKARSQAAAAGDYNQ